MKNHIFQHEAGNLKYVLVIKYRFFLGYKSKTDTPIAMN